MPHAPATRPPITTTEMWLDAPMTSSRMPTASTTAPITGVVCVRFTGAFDPGTGDPGTGDPGGVGTGAWGAYPRGMGAGGMDP